MSPVARIALVVVVLGALAGVGTAFPWAG